MSKEEVERKLAEIKKLYGAPPQAILDVEAKTVKESIDNEQEPEFDEAKVLEENRDDD